MPGLHGSRTKRPLKVLHGIPNHETYRVKLERKWLRKGFNVRFA